MPNYLEQDVENIQQETGKVMTAIAQMGAMAVALIPRRKPKVKVEPPKEHPPPPQAPPPQYAHNRVGQDIGYAQRRLADGAAPNTVTVELQGLSRRFAVTTDVAKAQRYLTQVTQRADLLNKTGGGNKVPVHVRTPKPKR